MKDYYGYLTQTDRKYGISNPRLTQVMKKLNSNCESKKDEFILQSTTTCIIFGGIFTSKKIWRQISGWPWSRLLGALVYQLSSRARTEKQVTKKIVALY